MPSSNNTATRDRRRPFDAVLAGLNGPFVLENAPRLRSAPTGRPSTRVVAPLVIAGLAVLLFLPLCGRHLYPDQDIPIGLALADLARGGWSPATLVYPSAWTNLLRGVFRLWLLVAPLDSGTVDDLLALWCSDPWRLRLVPRALAALAGLATLAATLRLGTIAGGPWGGVLATIYLGTAAGFVREHAHGMLDAPAAAAGMWALVFAARHVVTGASPSALLAGLCGGLALSFKYNLALVAPGILAGLLLAPGTRRTGLAAALVGGLLAVLATSPGLVLEPLRALDELTTFAARQASVLRAATTDGNRLRTAFVLGLGWPVLVLAGLGGAVAIWKRERILAPLGAFVLGYGTLLAASPLVLNRYALPLMAPVAVLAARAVVAIPARWARLLLTAAALATGLPETIGQVRLTLAEDTRVAAARWIEAHLPGDTPLYLTSGPYAAPDLPAAALDPFSQIPGGLGRPLPARCTHRRPLRAIPLLPRSGGQLAAMVSNGVVITAEPPAAVFTPLSTPSALLDLLRAHGEEIVAFRSHEPAGRRLVWEPFDQNYLPVAGAIALDHPGPTIRLWKIAPPSPDHPRSSM